MMSLAGRVGAAAASAVGATPIAASAAIATAAGSTAVLRKLPWTPRRRRLPLVPLPAALQLAGLRGVSGVAERDPSDESSTTMKTYHAVGRSEGAKAAVLCGGHKVVSDVPFSMGGKESAPQPMELLLSALVGCEAATATFVARSMKPRLHLESIDFSLDAERDVRGQLSLPVDEGPPVPAQLTRITGTAAVRLAAGEELPAGGLALLKEQVESRSPVTSMIRASGCDMEVEWVLDSGEKA
eukprot:TRINITY_DN12236_c0_g1_i1.p1 TRINITY_DN12236_c0_g1~~TRINITY_DN12236_c0_g1_i1.p1  ORF type:complete len:241 (-),score=62.08 TRINITY_DN12236_c0_g1_i1:63-785(-)